MQYNCSTWPNKHDTHTRWACYSLCSPVCIKENEYFSMEFIRSRFRTKNVLFITLKHFKTVFCLLFLVSKKSNLCESNLRKRKTRWRGKVRSENKVRKSNWQLHSHFFSILLKIPEKIKNNIQDVHKVCYYPLYRSKGYQYEKMPNHVHNYFQERSV